jgi:hypothetical protein
MNLNQFTGSKKLGIRVQNMDISHHCCPTNFVQYSCNLVSKGDLLSLLALPDMKGLIWTPLLPPGDGRDEAGNQSVQPGHGLHFNPGTWFTHFDVISVYVWV